MSRLGSDGPEPTDEQGFHSMLSDAMIRPALQSLRQLPTLFQVAETWGKLELKLETNDTRYWVTTEGVPRKTSGAPINYVVDYVTVEKLSPDGNWDLKAVYSPEAWKLSQGFDYCQMLQAQLDRLAEERRRPFSWDRVHRIEEVEQELHQANRDRRRTVREAASRAGRNRPPQTSPSFTPSP